ncbi:MAG: poly-gamma-glutamate biosynthesis protein PgsC [Gammaproteobacteria bacterium]|nr:poly-gamma-glutamate biosynthesis protein PgsC [Gammaproteobacteria bacterium]NND53866.1 poly-gamma-glutamate biosynthesis protein PgsC [Gammaproteobacteria bacterium]
MITLNLLALAIGVGLLVTLLVTEAFGIAAGGLVVPGYMALKLMQPVNLAITIFVALATFAIVRVLSSFMVIYGRRMTGLTILTAYLIGAILEITIGGGVAINLTPENAAALGDTSVDNLNQTAEPVFVELGVIGYIIPGLIALWFNRQGVVQTLAALAITSVLVRLVLIVIIPDVMIAYDRGELSFIELLAQLLGGDGTSRVQ